ncbi:hypothetical protein [Catenuloplanes atrovinosus]|uniref:Uncharacterized protein n=1 Tax=Catenuloplanes atrovinosus TaxID=137266 RepID=A0AAE3YX74_9ACTN|nr:hypothetical protein [Catenuloplanes atrovinosus]MDR7280882.1 hypothetical protein [Catenuloplanes atrovinosus]
MSPVPVEIISRPQQALSTVIRSVPAPEPTGVVITQIDDLTGGNQRGCGDDNPYR